jgi:DNA-binding winged helix-turn-helix (wHTH) protein/Tol biopolymer transport system component
MAVPVPKSLFRFGLFELDARAGQLRKNGARIRLPQQPLQVLLMLLERPGEVVTREELRKRLWAEDVFVDFDHGLNKSVQKLRDALGDSADSPRYIETIPRVGYRFLAPVSAVEAQFGEQPGSIAERLPEEPSTPAEKKDLPTRRSTVGWYLAAGVCLLLALGGIVTYRWRHRPLQLTYTQLTDFTDSAVAPVLSPDGRVVAFIRGDSAFLTTDQIYVKMLPDGGTKRVTDDRRPKYGLAFSPDGSEIAYTVLDSSGFSTYEVSALGGEPQLLMKNAAGLVWLDPQRLLFSEVRSGLHMGVVSATPTRAGLRVIYFPAHQRGMAHYSFASPDRRWAVVEEMNGNGDWSQCRLVGLAGQSGSRVVGPAAPCTSAGWSPDGRWLYFTAWVQGQSHIWRQRFPNGAPEQITFGPTNEVGVAVEPNGRGLITSVGTDEESMWIHDGKGDRQLSSEGDVVGEPSPPEFSSDGRVLYYLLRREGSSGAELWRTVTGAGQSEAVFPGVSISSFDLSPDGKQVVYTTGLNGSTQLWVAAFDRSSEATNLEISGAQSPHFGPGGLILFQRVEGNTNYLEQIDRDGSRRSRVLPYPITEFQSVSPNRHWIIASVPRKSGNHLPEIMVIPVDGGASRRICSGYCRPMWSPNGRFLFISLVEPSRTDPGRTLAIPLLADERLPYLPAEGISPTTEPSMIPGSEWVSHGEAVPRKDPEHYAWMNTTAHWNLYRISFR